MRDHVVRNRNSTGIVDGSGVRCRRHEGREGGVVRIVKGNLNFGRKKLEDKVADF
jgi:hypothetical protein